MSREHCTARLERVWGPGDGRPVSELKVEMDQMLQEYLMSRELGRFKDLSLCIQMLLTYELTELLIFYSLLRRMRPLCQGT